MNDVLPAEIGALKEHFQVSWEAMIIRLNELGIQDRDASRWLLTWNLGLREQPYLVPSARDEAIEVLRRRERWDLLSWLGVHEA